MLAAARQRSRAGSAAIERRSQPVDNGHQRWRGA
jgi:hypothetical protein